MYGECIKRQRRFSAIFDRTTGNGNNSLVLVTVHCIARASHIYSTILNCTTSHGETAVSVYIHRSAVAGRTIFDRTAVHHKESLLLHKNRSTIIIGSAANDGTAIHSKGASLADIYRTSVVTSFAIADSAAVHRKFALR